jgi:hypothetical protein
MMRLIGFLILFFVVISIGPALLQKFLGSLNPMNWIMQASKKTADGAIQDNVECLKKQARQYGLDAEATAMCGGKQGTDYIHCMKEFLSAQPVGKDLSEYCAGKNVETTLKSAPENLAIQKACSYVPWWVPNWLEEMVGLGDCISRPL